MRRFALLIAFSLSLTAAALGAPQFTLSWADNSTNEAGFAIERAIGAGPELTFVEIARVGADVVTYVDAGLAVDTSYSYRLRAYNAAGYSAYSNTATGRTLPPVPAAPGDLVVPDEPPVLLLSSDVRIEGNLTVAGTITQVPAAPAN